METGNESSESLPPEIKKMLEKAAAKQARSQPGDSGKKKSEEESTRRKILATRKRKWLQARLKCSAC